MRTPSLLLPLAVVGFVTVGALAAACGSTSQTAPGVDGGSSGSSGGSSGSGSSSGSSSSGGSSGGSSSGGSSGGSSSGGGSGGSSGACTPPASSSPSSGPTPTGFYVPKGCGYGVTPATSWGFTALALDDSTATTDPPTRVRLGMGGVTTMGSYGYPDPTTTAAITWETTTANAASELKIGTSAGALTQTQTGYSWTLSGITGSNYMHEVHVCGLEPGTTYYYQVGGGSGAGTWSATQSFTTVPACGTMTFGISGDSRDSTTPLQGVHVRFRNAAVNFQVYSGDFVDLGTDETEWTTNFNAIWKDSSNNLLTLGQQLIAPIAGNHEDEATLFFSEWPIPSDGTYAKTYYSFNAGNAHFIEFDDEILSAGAPQTSEAAAQVAWITSDLAAANANRANYPFIIFVSHRSLYSTSTHADDADCLYVRSILAPLFDQYKVDLVLNGHDHDYERTYPLIGGQNASCASPCTNVSQGMGTVYMINGGSGSDAYATGQFPAGWKVVGQSFGSGTPYDGVYAIGTMNGNTLTIKAYGLTSSGSSVEDDTLIDTVVFTR